MSSILFKNAALLDPLQAELLAGHDVLVEDSLIKEVSDRPIQATADRTIDLKGRTLMPGLIDLHVHAIAVELNLAQQVHMPNVLVTLRSTLLLRGMLRRGFTTVRDAGGAGHALKQAIETGLTDGPRLFVSGRALSQTGGHGDMRARSDYLASDAPCPCCVRVGALARVADGVDGVRRAAREELQMGADQIKIMASGGVASPTDPVGAFGYSEDEIRAIVEEARGRQTYVLAHAYTAAAIERAVRCGVRTIEHGNLRRRSDRAPDGREGRLCGADARHLRGAGQRGRPIRPAAGERGQDRRRARRRPALARDLSRRRGKDGLRHRSA